MTICVSFVRPRFVSFVVPSSFSLVLRKFFPARSVFGTIHCRVPPSRAIPRDSIRGSRDSPANDTRLFTFVSDELEKKERRESVVRLICNCRVDSTNLFLSLSLSLFFFFFFSFFLSPNHYVKFSNYRRRTTSFICILPIPTDRLPRCIYFFFLFFVFLTERKISSAGNNRLS